MKLITFLLETLLGGFLNAFGFYLGGPKLVFNCIIASIFMQNVVPGIATSTINFIIDMLISFYQNSNEKKERKKELKELLFIYD